MSLRPMIPTNRAVPPLLAILLLIGCGPKAVSPSTPGVTAKVPSGFVAQQASGMNDRIEGIVAVGPRNAANTFSATISVFVEPTLQHGGRWPNADALASHEIDVLTSQKADGVPNGYTLLDDKAATLDGATGRTVTFDLQLAMPHGRRPVNIRQRIVFVTRGARIYRVSYLADASDYATHEPAFDSYLARFKFK